eukprot:gene10799-11953_t
MACSSSPDVSESVAQEDGMLSTKTLSVNQIKTFDLKNNNISLESCLTLSENSQGNLIVGTDNGAYLLSSADHGATVISRFLVLSGNSQNFNEVPSAVFSQDTPSVVYLATDNSILGFDTRINCAGSSNSLVKKDVVVEFTDNTEEINQLSISGHHLAACDDSGEVRIYDLVANRNFRTLRKKHKNICSSVCFRPTTYCPGGRSGNSELFSAGLDCQVFLWNYSRIRTLSFIDTQKEFSANEGKSMYMMSPPMVNDIDCSEDGTVLACGIGNGSVVLCGISKERRLNVTDILTEHSSLGVACVKLCTFDNKSYLLSGGNDCKVNVWQFPAEQDCFASGKFKQKQLGMTSKIAGASAKLSKLAGLDISVFDILEYHCATKLRMRERIIFEPVFQLRYK